jgi:putative flippase GtrA
MGVPYYIATPCSFLIAVSGNYLLSRRFVFKGTQRSWHRGYIYFAVVALLGAGVTTILMIGLVSWLGVYFLVARTIVAGLVGMANYLFNLYVNFKVVGVHHGHK